MRSMTRSPAFVEAAASFSLPRCQSDRASSSFRRPNSFSWAYRGQPRFRSTKVIARAERDAVIRKQPSNHFSALWPEVQALLKLAADGPFSSRLTPLPQRLSPPGSIPALKTEIAQFFPFQTLSGAPMPPFRALRLKGYRARGPAPGAKNATGLHHRHGGELGSFRSRL